MAKNKTGILVLCLVLFWISLAGSVLAQKVLQSYPVLPEVTLLRQKLIAFELSKVGIKEKTGNNDGPDVKKILASVGLKEGNPWCAAGQSFCHIALNIPNPESGYSPDWFRANVVYRKGAERISPFVFRGGEVTGYWIPAKGRIGHVGMARKQIGFDVYTTEFNYNNRVMNVLRSYWDIYIVSDFVGWKEYLHGVKQLTKKKK
jgi:hypothetical protein